MAKAAPGALATIHDVARAAGVSTRTATRVTRGLGEVRPQMRRRVEEVIERLRYAPNPQAQALSLGRSQLIGLPFDNPNPDYVIRVQGGILEGLKGTDHELIVHACDAGGPALADDLRVLVRRLKLWGLILIPPFSDDPRLPPMLAAIGCPYVRIAATPGPETAPTVRGRDRAGARAAARHLLALGHRRLALIAGPPGFGSSLERRAGFEDALAERGLSAGEAHVVIGAYTFESGVAAAEQVFALAEPPTGVFASNDEMAAGFLLAAQRRGLTAPADFSLVGFDDLAIARMTSPALTTVRMPTRQFGREAARLLLSGTAADAARLPDLEPQLMIRQSCAAPPERRPAARRSPPEV